MFPKNYIKFYNLLKQKNLVFEKEKEEKKGISYFKKKIKPLFLKKLFNKKTTVEKNCSWVISYFHIL